MRKKDRSYKWQLQCAQSAHLARTSHASTYPLHE